jgi:hypothetical protein
MRDTFIDPLTGFVYEWQVGHDEEASVGKTRNITHSGNTAGTGLIRQQGEPAPLVLRYSGKILHLHQFEEMWRFYELCETQTIYYRDYFGEEFEVVITQFEPIREKTVSNKKDLTNMPLHYYSYTIAMEIVKVRAGALVGLSP